MEMPEETEDTDTEVAPKAEIYLRLITVDDPQFPEWENEEDAPDVPDEENIAPRFAVNVVEGNIGKGMHETIMGDIGDEFGESPKLLQFIRGLTQTDIEELPPIDTPTTETIHVGNVTVTPAGDGFMADFQFDRIIDELPTR